MTIGNYTEMDSNCAERKKKITEEQRIFTLQHEGDSIIFFSVKIYKFSNV